MTYPPPGPARPGPHPPLPGPYGQPGAYGPRPGPPPPAFPGVPPQFSGPGGRPPRKRTGLIAGIAAAVVVVVAVALTLVFTLGGDDGDPARTTAAGTSSSARPTARANSSTVSPPSPRESSGGGGTSGTADSVAQTVVDTMNARSAARYSALTCQGHSQSDVSSLQSQWDAATELRARVTGPAKITGDTAQVPVELHYNGEQQDAKMPLERQGLTWCVDES